MKLIAFSCNNIGPFFDTTVSTFLRDWKYLIKAPIGSGKSFLFFDWPVFALYKNSSRPLLSIKATQWRVKILFEHDGKILVCIRNITRTKYGNDTVKSLLYTIENTVLEDIISALSKHDTIAYQQDIFDSINTIGTRNQIECKNETDIQATLEPFLPAQEVFLTTTILMQDSTNVFELTPGDRIALFKEIFGLLSIDSATDKISDEKKAVSALLKSKQVTDDTDINLRKYLQAWCRIIEPLQTDSSNIWTYIQDIQMIVEHITIIWFTRDINITTTLQNLQQDLTIFRNEKQTQIWALQTWQKTYDEHLSRWRILESDKITLENKIKFLQSELQLMQEKNKDFSQSQWENIQNAYITWQQSLPENWFSSLSIKDSKERNFSLLRDEVQQFMQQWIMLAAQEKHGKSTIEQLEQTLETDQKNIKNYENQLAALQWDYEQKKKFYCEKIGEDCPFIEGINNGFFSTLQKSIDRMQVTLEETKKHIHQKNTLGILQETQQQIISIQEQLASFRQHIWYRAYSLIKGEKTAYDLYLEKQKQLQAQQQQQQTIIQKNAEITGQLLSLETQYQDLKKTIAVWEEEKITLTNRIDPKLQTEILNAITESDKKLNAIHQWLQHIERIEHLIQTHKDTQWVIKWLREREELLTDLYRIFSKEIMIKVLEDALPFFAEYVNNILAKMVSFSIHFIPKKTASDKLELDIIIRDQHGERSVKSLSGGQKAILRLAWILGVAQMTHASQLFLDETINNIDQDTIGLVADMLEDYVKLHDVSLYLVTHSGQLQHMQVWDSIIAIKSI